MESDAEELLAVRRLLKEVADRAVRLEVELEQARAAAFEAQLATTALIREREERLLHVFGCAGCHGEHRVLWTQALSPPATVMHMGTAAQIECQRAYVCPANLVVVLVSNESEETYARNG